MQTCRLYVLSYSSPLLFGVQSPTYTTYGKCLQNSIIAVLTAKSGIHLYLFKFSYFSLKSRNSPFCSNKKWSFRNNFVLSPTMLMSWAGFAFRKLGNANYLVLCFKFQCKNMKSTVLLTNPFFNNFPKNKKRQFLNSNNWKEGISWMFL